MTKEYSAQEEIPTGYNILATGEIESWEHTAQKTKEGGITLNSKRQKQPVPAHVTDEELEVLIGTYLYSYLDKPKAMPTHNRNLLSALLELKKIRSE